MAVPKKRRSKKKSKKIFWKRKALAFQPKAFQAFRQIIQKQKQKQKQKAFTLTDGQGENVSLFRMLLW